MRALLSTLCLVLAACGGQPDAAPPGAAEATWVSSATKALPAFVDKVWVVEDSPQVAPGEVRAFLADGSLLMSSPHALPATGSWTYEQQQLRITEEGQVYPADILELTADTLRLQMHSPGEPVLITFSSAGEVLHFSGTVRYLDLEGGHYVITDAAGTNFNPLDLPEEFRGSGLEVEVDARRRDDMMSINMSGPQIEVLRIRLAGSAAGAGAAGVLGGVWTVVAHYLPGTSAMDEAQARAWHDRTLRLEADEARLDSSLCAAPAYVYQTVKRAALLAEYRLAADSLPPLAGAEQLQVLRVSCNAAAWDAPGNSVIGIDAQRALLPWDGVFFELRRDHDFRALGQEPGWRLDLRKGRDLHFVYDYGEGELRLPAPPPSRNGNTTVYRAGEGDHRLELTIVAAKCSDVMSGEPFAAEVTVVLDGRRFKGCGGDRASQGEGS